MPLLHGAQVKFEQIQGNRKCKLTIQNSVSFAKLEYWSIVERTLKMRQISTIMNLQREEKRRECTQKSIRGFTGGTKKVQRAI